MLDLTGKVAYVTGAGSGIGRGMALALAEAGADIAASDIDGGRAEATARMVRDMGRTAIARETDVREYAALERDCADARSELGRLDIAVANAGIGRGGSVYQMSEDDWHTQIEVNLTGVFLSVKAASREMIRQNEGGRIVCTSSLAGENAAPGLSAYCASKAGVRMMVRCWAQELAPFGITVNSIGPGIIDTPLGAGLIGEGDDRAQTERRVPLGRVGYPADIGKLTCWLASDEAEYVTGQYHLIDGGLGDASGFNIDSPRGQQIQFIRESRQKMPGTQLLDTLDGMMSQGMAEANRMREARGLR